MFKFKFNENEASRLFRPLAYDEASQVFVCDDRTMAFSFICTPACGWDTKMLTTIKLMLNDGYPTDSSLQFCLWSNPDVRAQLRDTDKLRAKCHDPLLRKSHDTMLGHIWGGTTQPIELVQETKVRNFQLVITFKMPISSIDATSDEIEKAVKIKRQMLQRLKRSYLAPSVMDKIDYLRLMDSYFHWSHDAEWRNSLEQNVCDITPLNEQIIQPDTKIEKTRNGVLISTTTHKTFVNMLTVRRFPRETYAGNAFKWIGDAFDGQGSVTQNFMITLNVSFPENSSVKSKMESKKNRYIRNSFSALTRFAPKINDVKRDLEEITASLDADDHAVKVSLNAMVFGQNEQEADDGIVSLQSFMRQAGVTMLMENSFSIPSFINSMPFGVCTEAVKKSFRYFTMTTKHALPMIPLFSEWKGTKTPEMQFISRTGQLMNFSLFDSTTNYNTLIYAESGSGKSYLTNEIIRSYLSTGNKIWAIDAGESYKKISKSFKGSYTAFNESNDISLNPFTMIDDRDRKAFLDSLDMLAGVIMAMAFTSYAPSDLQHSEVERILMEVWREKGKKALIDDVAAKCLEQTDVRVRDIGVQLYAFTTKGQFGHFFDKPHNIEFKGNFNVLELDGLDKTPRLQAVVLFMLMVQISHSMYEEFKLDRNIKRLVIIDEAWDLLGNSPAVTAFMEKGFRRFRKYNGSGIVVTQSINDLQKSEAGKAIAENAANSLILKQKESTIASAENDNLMSLPPAAYRLLKKVTTESGHYSEIFFNTNRGMGVGRLIVDPLRNLMYSTNPKDNAAIDEHIKRGCPLDEAMMNVIDERDMMRYDMKVPAFLTTFAERKIAEIQTKAALSMNSPSASINYAPEIDTDLSEEVEKEGDNLTSALEDYHELLGGGKKMVANDC